MYYHLAILWNQLRQFNSAVTLKKINLNVIFNTGEISENKFKPKRT